MKRTPLWTKGALAGAITLAVAALTTLVWTLLPPRTLEPFYGAHQGGIVTASQKFAFVGAFDLTTSDPREVRTLLQTWTRAAAALTQGLPLEGNENPSVPTADTGEILGFKPSRLTLTFGVGPSLFDGRFGLADRRPKALVTLPDFPGDNLNPQWSGGDLVVQVGSDDYQTAYHALHNLTRLAKGVAVPRWVQPGFQPGLEVNARGPGRNLQGFHDGTVNPDPADARAMDQTVWVDQGPGWLRGGSYLVVRRIRMFVETWDRSSLADQEASIGRDKAKGLPLPSQAENSHVRLARGAGVEKILRRPFSYVNGLDSRTGQWDSGLLFLAWMKDPGRQFVPMQTRLSSYDALNEYIQPVGSAVFAVFPGVTEGDYVGSGLFPTPPLAARVEGLLSRLGGLYEPLGREDWKELGAGAQAWIEDWNEARREAGVHGQAVETQARAWLAELTSGTPNPEQVRQTQAGLIRSLVTWQQQITPATPPNTKALEALGNSLSLLKKQWDTQGPQGAQSEFEGFVKQWTLHEGLVRSLDPAVYAQMELLVGQIRRALHNPGDSPLGPPTLETMATKLRQLAPPRTYTAWDAGILLFREGLEALLVLAALLAFLAKTDNRTGRFGVWAGATAGVGVSLGVAFLVSQAMAGWVATTAPELVEGITGLAAVALLLAAGVWLHGNTAVRDRNQWLKEQMSRSRGGQGTLALVAFLAVFREGVETVVFFGGMATTLGSTDLVLGLAGGLGVLAILGILLIGFSKRLPLSVFFLLATVLLWFLTVKILGQSLGALQVLGWLSATPLSFGGPVAWLGFTPTWETALPQLVLTLGLGVSLVTSKKKKA